MKRHPALVPLSREHTTALALALRISREIPDADDAGIAAAYDDLISFWARGLLPHFRTENECLLARLVRHVPPTDDLIVRTQQDHLGIEALVADMRDNAGPEPRRGLLLAFGDRLRTHVRWEEDVLFQATQDQLTAPELAVLGNDITARVGAGSTAAHDVFGP